MITFKIKDQKTYFYIALGSCILLSMVLFSFTILPVFKSWHTLRTEISRKNKELQSRLNTIKQNQQLKDQIGKLEKTYGRFSSMFFAPNDIPQAVKAIADISQDLQIQFISLTPLTSKKLEGPALEKSAFSLWQNPIAIKIKTDYLKLVDFIERIENSHDKFIKIDNLKIKKDPNNLLAHNVEMNIYVFSLQEQKP